MRGIGGAIGGALGGLFGGGGNDPGAGAMNYLDKIPGLYDPYIQAGNRGLPTLEQQYGMGADPSQTGNILSQLGAGYQQSPGYQYSLDQALKGVDRASAAGGTLGTPGAMTAAAGAAQGIASQDYNSYLQNALGLRQQGLSGLQGLYNTGYDATTGTANAYQTQAQLEYERQAAQNAAGAQAGGGIGGAIGSVIGGLF